MTPATPSPRRLDPCPCGSGRRYKDCHGSLQNPNAQEVRALNLEGLEHQGRLEIDAAIACFRKAIELAPSTPESHLNLALVLLLSGNEAEGWRELEWRTRVPGYGDYANFSFGMPRWRGEPLAGKRLLVHAEQGQGDTIQFARYLGPLAKSGVEIDLFCHPPLVSFMSRIAGVRSATTSLVERPTHDYHAPLLDIAAHFVTDPKTPRWPGPYVAPLDERVDRWRRELEGRPRPWIGIAWKGSPRHANDRNRSLPTAQAATLVEGVDATFMSLQVEPHESLDRPNVIDLAPRLADWDDTAGVFGLLDVLVTVDTAAAHVAGAMELPTWLLLPFSPDWRWGLSDERTAWYPSLRLFRQAGPGEWRPVLERVRQDLHIGTRRNPSSG